DPALKDFEPPSFFRMGSWIGGDRDGNPFVTADTLHQALRMQSDRAIGFYFEELHALGAELSLDGRLVDVSDEVKGLAERSPDRSPHREEEPYRRAISGLYARLAATVREFGMPEPQRRAPPAQPYPTPAAYLDDLGALHRSLIVNRSVQPAPGRLKLLPRPLRLFGL